MRIVKKLLGFLLILIVLAAGAGYVFFFVVHPKKRASAELKAPSTPEAIERGRYLATHVMGCLGFHSEGDVTKPGDPHKPGTEGGGRDFGDIPDFPGHIRAPNITPDPEHGVGKWTDGELVRALREGLSRDGRVLFPMMPYGTYHDLLSDEDALAIVAFLRSLKPLPNNPGPMEVKFPVSMFIRLAPQPVETPAGAAPTEKLARGRWLLRVASCTECHTPSEKGKPIEGMEYAGGGKFPLPIGDLYVPNITSDQATGIGAYSDEDLLRVLNEGVNKAGKSLYMMPWTLYRGMTDEDKQALIAAMREIKPIANVVPASTIKR